MEGTSENELEAEASFVPTHCRTTLISIKKPILPPIDEELAKKAGAKDAEDLHRRAADLLTKRAENRPAQK